MFTDRRLVHMVSLRDAYYLCSFICMRTTLDLDEDLLKSAMSAVRNTMKTTTKTAVIEQGLRELVARAARERLASLYGSDPTAKAPPRRRAAPKR